MGSPDFPLSRIHSVAAASCTCWFTVSLAAHLLTKAHWKGYSSLRPTERFQWCNKISCGIFAAVLVYHQMWNLSDPVLNADPLNGTTPGHFLWASVLFGYLIYDTLYSLLFFSWRSGAAFLLHHVVGLGGCALGLYANKLALFGMAIEVFFEATNPLLHALGCMRIAKRTEGRAYRLLGIAFTVQFFVFRVAISNVYFVKLLRTVLGLQKQPWWAWAGVAVFGLLNALNAFWFLKLARMAVRSKKGPAPARDASPGQPDANASERLAQRAQQKAAGAIAGGLKSEGAQAMGGKVIHVTAYAGGEEKKGA